MTNVRSFNPAHSAANTPNQSAKSEGAAFTKTSLGEGDVFVNAHGSPNDCHCRVCGLKSDKPLYGERVPPSYEMCACCGTEHGADDTSRPQILEARRQWAKCGYSWFRPSSQPPNWNRRAQMSNIPEDYQDDV